MTWKTKEKKKNEKHCLHFRFLSQQKCWNEEWHDKQAMISLQGMAWSKMEEEHEYKWEMNNGLVRVSRDRV